MRKALLLTAICFFIVSNAWSAGFQLYNEGSARVMALGAAVTARTDLVESAWYNPSATVFLKRTKFMTGVAFVYPSIEFKSYSTGKKYEMTKMLHPLPYFYAVYPMRDRISLNFSFNVPYGLTTDWDGDWEGRYEAVYTSLRCYLFVPSLGIKLTDNFSVGFGPQVVYADAEMKKAIQTPLGDVDTELTGSDWKVGWLISATYRIKEHTSIGVIYRSQISLDIDGDAKYYNVNSALSNIFRNGEGEVFLNLPDTLAVGISTNYFSRWILSFDLLWSGWGAYDELKFKYEYKPGTGTPGTISQLKDWKDVVAVRLGAEYLLNDSLNFRFGYVYDTSPINDQTRGAELPTDDRQLFNIGLGYRKKNLGIDFAYTYLIMKDSKPGTTTSYLNGEYKGNAHIFAFDIRYQF